MEYFGVFQRLLGHFVLISFRTYDGFLIENVPSAITLENQKIRTNFRKNP
jgi:hypothetical protein